MVCWFSPLIVIMVQLPLTLHTVLKHYPDKGVVRCVITPSAMGTLHFYAERFGKHLADFDPSAAPGRWEAIPAAAGQLHQVQLPWQARLR
jgi:hypothetical protein